MKRLLTLLLTAVLGTTALAACGVGTGTLTVLGPWTGAEGQAFEAVLDAYGRA